MKKKKKKNKKIDMALSVAKDHLQEVGSESPKLPNTGSQDGQDLFGCC